MCRSKYRLKNVIILQACPEATDTWKHDFIFILKWWHQYWLVNWQVLGLCEGQGGLTPFYGRNEGTRVSLWAWSTDPTLSKMYRLIDLRTIHASRVCSLTHTRNPSWFTVRENVINLVFIRRSVYTLQNPLNIDWLLKSWHESAV